MKKVILLPIYPNDLKDILEGRKKIEIIKSTPNCDLPIDVYLYCTNSGLNLYSECIEVWQRFDGDVAEPFCEFKRLRVTNEKLEINKEIRTDPLSRVFREKLNGKVVAKFILNVIDKYQIYDDYCKYGRWFKNEIPINDNQEIEEFLKQSCFDDEELDEYVGMEDIEIYQYGIKPKTGHFSALRIRNLEIFNKAMELDSFYQIKKCKVYISGYVDGCIDFCGCYEDLCKNGHLRIIKAPHSWQYVYVEVEHD